MLAELHRAPPVEGDLADLKAGGQLADVVGNPVVVDDVAGRGRDQPVARPGVVGHAVFAGLLDQLLLGHPEVRQPGVVLGLAFLVRDAQHKRRDVGGRGQVEPAVGRCALEQLDIERAVAQIPGFDVQPAGVLLGPLVEMQAPERVLIRRGHLGPLALSAEIVELDRHAEVWVGFRPDLLVRPVVLLVGGENDRVEGRVVDRAVEHLAGVFVQLPADRVPVESRRGDGDRDRLAPRAGRGREHVPQIPVGLSVQLVDDDAVCVEAVLCVGVRRQHAVDVLRKVV